MKQAYRTIMVVGIIFLAACDPGELTRQKVPEPLKSWLTFDAQGPGKAPAVASLEIVQPKPDSILSATAPVTFQAKAEPGRVKPGTTVEVHWSAFSSDGKSQEIGKGTQIQKKLEPGTYRARALMVVGQQKLEREVHFRVAINMSGKILFPPGGAADAKVIVQELFSGQKFSETTVKPDGTFLVEVPAEEYVIVKPMKTGYSFHPLYRVTKFGSDDKLDFGAAEGTITNLKLNDSANPDEGLREGCPNQVLQMSMEVTSKFRPRSFQAALVVQDNQGERIIPLEDFSPAGGAKSDESEAPRVFTARLPSLSDLQKFSGLYRVRVTVTDEQDGILTAELPEPVKIDVKNCFQRGLSAVAEGLLAGEFSKAEKIASDLEKLSHDVEDPSLYRDIRTKISFNRGLAYLGLGLETSAEDPKRVQLLDKAVLAFTSVLKLNARDQEAVFLVGLAHHLAGRYDTAIKMYTKVINYDPKAITARMLRAYARAQHCTKQELSDAVDDLTQAITADPSQKELRKVRSALFKLLMEAEGKKADEKVSTAAIPLPDLKSLVRLSDYIRK